MRLVDDLIGSQADVGGCPICLGKQDTERSQTKKGCFYEGNNLEEAKGIKFKVSFNLYCVI